MNGKGDKRRPAAVPPAVVESNWERTFAKQPDPAGAYRDLEAVPAVGVVAIVKQDFRGIAQRPSLKEAMDQGGILEVNRLEP